MALLNPVLARAAHCTAEEKAEHCLPLIERIYELASTARSKGILSLDREVEKLPFSVLKTGLTWVTEGLDPDWVYEGLSNGICLGGSEGIELFMQLLSMEGVLMILEGDNPAFILKRLVFYLGRDLEKEANAYFENTSIMMEGYNENRILEYLASYKCEEDAPLCDPVLKACLLAPQNLSIILSYASDIFENGSLAGYLSGLRHDDLEAVLYALPFPRASALIDEIESRGGYQESFFESSQSELLSFTVMLLDRGEISTDKQSYSHLSGLFEQSLGLDPLVI